MKIKTIVEEISKYDLVTLFADSTYHSSWLSMTYRKVDYTGTKLEDKNDCREDVWAKILLDGKNVYVRDFYAEDDDDFHGNLPHLYDDGLGCMRYTISLKDIKSGIERALNNDSHIRKYIYDWMSGDVDFDAIEAEAIMQWIVFGEEIYG